MSPVSMELTIETWTLYNRLRIVPTIRTPVQGSRQHEFIALTGEFHIKPTSSRESRVVYERAVFFETVDEGVLGKVAVCE